MEHNVTSLSTVSHPAAQCDTWITLSHLDHCHTWISLSHPDLSVTPGSLCHTRISNVPWPSPSGLCSSVQPRGRFLPAQAAFTPGRSIPTGNQPCCIPCDIPCPAAPQPLPSCLRDIQPSAVASVKEDFGSLPGKTVGEIVNP